MDDIKSLIINIRKEIDSISELAWNEYKTGEIVNNYIADNKNLVFQEKTALVYKLDFGAKENIIIRSELDALNTKNGPRHVCGHSTHTSVLIGLYKYLESSNKKYPFNIYFVFQPSEEGFPSGAEFIANEYFKKNNVDIEYSIAFHTYPSNNQFAIFDAKFGSGDYFEVDISTEGSHIKNKNNIRRVDSIGIASRIAYEINSDFKNDFIINVGTMKGGESPNSLSSYSLLTGDIRSLSVVDRESAHNYLREIISGLQTEFDYAHIELRLSKYYNVLENDKEVIEKLKNKNFISDYREISLATEDFSFYPGKHLFLLYGTGNDIELHNINYSVPLEVNTKLIDEWLKLLEILSDEKLG